MMLASTLRLDVEEDLVADDKPLIPVEVALTGKLITGEDATVISPTGEANFQSLKNMRYTDTNPKSIAGMTKINTTALSSHPKIRSGIHFKKDQPSENHVLVQAFNSGETESKVFQNTTAIPNTGDFAATALHTDSSGSSVGVFSKALAGNIAYCNGKESLVWGGDEHFSSGFVNYNPDGNLFKDYTTATQNTLTDSQNIATLTTVGSGTPQNTTLLLHLDNNVTDSSPTTPHTVTNNNVTFTTSAKMGTHAATFNGTNAYLTIPDNADFDFSGGVFTVDFYIKPTADGTIYSHATDANNWFRIAYSFNRIIVEINIAGVTTTILGLTSTTNIETGAWHHVEVTENGNDWYLFVDGSLVYFNDATITGATRAANYTGTVYIGAFYNGAVLSDYITADIDEFRIGKGTALHTDYFDPRNSAYGTAAAYVMVGAVRPIKGAKFYVGTANATASSVKVEEWQISSSGNITTGYWVDIVSPTDGTASGGVSLAQTGSITFSDTSATSKPRLFNNTYLYWYRFTFLSVDNTTTISQLTLDMSMQQIRDLWDGETRQELSFVAYNGANKYDNTINVFEPTYNSANTATFADIGGYNGELVVGFTEKLTGLDIRFVSENGNTVQGHMWIEYWSGGIWKPLSVERDGTALNDASMGQSGIIRFTSPLDGEEMRKTEEGKPSLYYYRIFPLIAGQGITYSANVKIYYIGGIPAQKQINGYKFPILSHNRLILCSDQDDKKNSIKVGASGSNSVFNGTDSIELSFGNDEELTAGVGLYSLFSSSLYNLTILCKKNETWVVEGNSPQNYTWYKASDGIGCVAPLTMKSVNVEPSDGNPGYHAAIWQGINGVYLYNGRDFLQIDEDISDVLGRINTSKIADSVAFVDEDRDEYHWLVATGASATLNEEWVFDVRRFKWYQIDRGTYLQSGFDVIDTSGNRYTYGSIDTGYLERLENGTTFDGSNIVSELHIGDVTLDGTVMTETQLRNIKLITVAKTNTANNISVTHYGDTKTTGTAFPAISPLASGSRVTKVTKSVNHQGGHIFHSLKFNLTTNDETSGLEPLYLGVYYKRIRESLGG